MIKYIPILRGKLGEFSALENIDEDNLYELSPLIQILPDRNLKRKGDYFKILSTKISKAWNFEGNLLFLDFKYTHDIEFIDKLLLKLSGNGLNIIPVISLASNDKYFEIIRKGYTANGLCVRLEKTHARPRKLSELLAKVSDEFEISENEIDILIDLGSITSHEDIFLYQNTFQMLYESIANRDNYRRIIISSGSFPEDVTSFKSNTITAINRFEWELWNNIKDEVNDPKLIYSDYGNIHPVFDPTIPGFPGSCSIKYTTENHFIIFRGIKASDHPEGGAQFHEKSRELISHECYDGRNFSWGDEFIYNCAHNNVTSGNLGTWVKVTLNHHLTKIVDILS
jgi:hypothetical protein